MGLAWKAGMIEDDEWRAEFLPEGRVTWRDQCRELGIGVAAVSRMVRAGLEAEHPDKYVRGWKLQRD